MRQSYDQAEQDKNQERDYCYSCVASHNKIGVYCINTHIHEAPLMEAISKAADQYLRAIGARENKRAMDNYTNLKNADLKLDARRDMLEESVASIKKQRQELYADLKEGMLTFSDYEYEKKRLADEQAYFEQELATIRNKNSVEKDKENMAQEYRSRVLSMQDERFRWTCLIH